MADDLALPEDRRRGRLDPRLLELLVCPLTRTTLQYGADKQELISRAARLAYPIRDGIPVMLDEEARAMSAEEVDALRK